MARAMSASETAARPAWFRSELFPFTSRFAEVDGARVHYVDEGSGPTLLLLHGNPTWSFLYRHVIAGLRDRFRCVALDYPGFGLSTAAPGYGFSAAEHRDVVGAFIRQLDLRDYTLMVQDWGGPIGLSAAVTEPDRVRALIIGNTWAWPMNDPITTMFSLTMGHLPAELLVRRLDLFTNVAIPRARGHSRLTADEMAMYRGPHPTPASRAPVQKFARELLAARPLLKDLQQRLPVLADLPALILWATADPAFRASTRKRWEQLLTKSETVILQGAGHFFQDDVPDEVVGAIRTWFPGT